VHQPPMKWSRIAESLRNTALQMSVSGIGLCVRHWDHESSVSHHWHLDLFCDMSCEFSYWAPLSYFVGTVFKSWS
jgi:hypothetical protein